ncbi:hypothetical protein ACP4OV_027520 [Aristida adscensionis]
MGCAIEKCYLGLLVFVALGSIFGFSVWTVKEDAVLVFRSPDTGAAKAEAAAREEGSVPGVNTSTAVAAAPAGDEGSVQGGNTSAAAAASPDGPKTEGFFGSNPARQPECQAVIRTAGSENRTPDAAAWPGKNSQDMKQTGPESVEKKDCGMGASAPYADEPGPKGIDGRGAHNAASLGERGPKPLMGPDTHDIASTDETRPKFTDELRYRFSQTGWKPELLKPPKASAGRGLSAMMDGSIDSPDVGAKKTSRLSYIEFRCFSP